MRIGVVINSCAAYEGVVVPRLLRSLAAAGVPMDRVHVVVGEAEASRDAAGAPSFHYRPTINIDNNGLLWLTQEPEAAAQHEWVVYLHDTCEVDAQFWDKMAAAVAGARPWVDAIRFHHPFSMGLGLYRVAWLKTPRVAQYMAALRNTDPARKQQVKQNADVTEDTLFKTNLGLVTALAPLSRDVVEEEVCLYGTRVPRIREYYHTAGVYKLKANWGQSTQLHTQL